MAAARALATVVLMLSLGLQLTACKNDDAGVSTADLPAVELFTVTGTSPATGDPEVVPIYAGAGIDNNGGFIIKWHVKAAYVQFLLSKDDKLDKNDIELFDAECTPAFIAPCNGDGQGIVYCQFTSSNKILCSKPFIDLDITDFLIDIGGVYHTSFILLHTCTTPVQNCVVRPIGVEFG